jgi:hypothetical protein
MSTRGIWLLLFLSITGWGADKAFKVEKASSYPNKQTNNGLTIAVVPFSTQEQTKPVFGKLSFRDFGLLPVLVVMQNDTDKAMRLDRMEVNYVTPSRREVVSTPASDVMYLDAPKRPNMSPGRIPNPLPPRPRKSKLAAPEIEGSAFNAKMLPPGDSAHGFVYFQIDHRAGSQVYIRGIVEAQSGKELLFFEIPLE